jgi:hypothetical protein
MDWSTKGMMAVSEQNLAPNMRRTLGAIYVCHVDVEIMSGQLTEIAVMDCECISEKGRIYSLRATCTQYDCFRW